MTLFTETDCDRLTGMGYPCLPYDGAIVWKTEATLGGARCRAVAGLPQDPDTFLQTDLRLQAELVAELSGNQLAALIAYQSKLIRKKRRQVLDDADTEDILRDSIYGAFQGVEIPDNTPLTKGDLAEYLAAKKAIWQAWPFVSEV